jgi:hypothetical protein
MGQMRFRIPNSMEYDPQIWSTAYVSGLEGIPWSGRNRIEGDCLVIDRAVNESGKLSIVWPTKEYGPVLLTTGSLRCSEQPYWLQLELARGTLHRVRGRGLDWQRVALKLPDAFSFLIDQSISAFIRAVLSTDDPDACCTHAQQSIDLAIAASKPLARAFISQSLQARHQFESRLSTLMGVRVNPSPTWQQEASMLLPVMNTMNVSMEMGQIEGKDSAEVLARIDAQMKWARENSLRIFAGPLLNLQQHAIPKWFYLFSDFESLHRATCEHAAKMVTRYRGQVHLWSAGGGLNSSNSLGLTDEQTIQLAVGLIQTVRSLDPKTPVIVNIDTPWAEFLAQRSDGISPLHFADALIRLDLGLSGLALELNLNCWPHGSLPRDLVDISDLIDHWNILGLPLMGIVTTPASTQLDPESVSKSQIVSTWKHPLPLASFEPQRDSEETVLVQSVERLPANGMEIVQMLMAKGTVHGIIWNQGADSCEHPFPNAGLIAPNGKQRPLLDGLARLRQMHVH